MPKGCRFYPRCPQAMKACMTAAPPREEAGPGHHYTCWLALIHKGLQVDEQGIACPGTESIVRGETAVGMADGHDLPYMDIRRSQEVDEITGIPAQCSNAEIRRQ